MTSEKFPQGTSQTSALLWVPGPDVPARVPAFCSVVGSSIEIESTGPLTPAFGLSDGPRRQPADESTDFVIHGTYNQSPYKLTFLGAHTVGRERVLAPFMKSFITADEEGLETHRINADWVITGVHLRTSSPEFTAVRARFSHLERWAALDGISWEIASEPGVDAVLTYSKPADVTAPYTQHCENATLRLSNQGSCSPPKNSSARLYSKCWLGLEDLSGWTLDDAFERFINPVRSLMAILAGEAADVLEVEVFADGRWCSVSGGHIKGVGEPDGGTGKPILLNRDKFPLELVGTWCGTATSLSPVPYIVEAALSDVFNAVEVEALQLTTSAEGMDNALHPDSRRFSEQEVEDAKRALKTSDVPDIVRNALSSELGGYLYKLSYPARMLRTAEAVLPAAPVCVGEPKRWKVAMRDLRNNLAHANIGGDDLDVEQIRTIHAQSRSLRWALQVRLLQQAGVANDELQSALNGSRQFGRDAELWEGMFTPESAIKD